MSPTQAIPVTKIILPVEGDYLLRISYNGSAHTTLISCRELRKFDPQYVIERELKLVRDQGIKGKASYHILENQS